MFKKLLLSVLSPLMNNHGLARVTGPLFSMSASGSVGKAITFANWKGVAYCREWFKPSNPQTANQVNVRTAFALAVAYYGTQSQAVKDAFDAFAEGTGKSGFDHFVGRAMNAYQSQLGSSTTPQSVSATDLTLVPNESWTWTPVT